MLRIQILLTTAILLVQVAPIFGQAPTPRPAFGINLSGPADWNTELPFVDVFRLSRPWISQRKGAAWGKGPALEQDEFGWVKRLEQDCFAETLMCTIEGGHYPSGTWNVYWKGQGKLEIPGGKVIEAQAGHLAVELKAGNGIFLRLLETQPDDPVRQIQVLMPGVTLEQAAMNPWRPEFLQMWSGVSCVRFMDFQETNNSHQQHWSDRPLIQHATYSQRGIPIELLCDLANRLQCDAWFCIPHLADDEYVEKFAQLVQKQLKAPARAYVEYSNEVWNAQFEQHRYAAQQGQKRKVASKSWEAAWAFTAQRSMEIFKLWQKHLPAERLVRVLASQAANSYVAEQITKFENAGKHADVLAIAPYIGFNVSPQGDGPRASEVANWSSEQVFDAIVKKSLPEAIESMVANKKIADKFGLRLVCYEAGQHLVGVGGAENDDKLTKVLTQANRDPRMQQVYAEYFAGWEKAGGDLLCYFSSVSASSKWGSWGLLEYSDSPRDQAPKFQAVQQWRDKLRKQAADGK